MPTYNILQRLGGAHFARLPHEACLKIKESQRIQFTVLLLLQVDSRKFQLHLDNFKTLAFYNTKA